MRLMRSIRFTAFTLLIAVYGLVMAQEEASKPATSVDVTSQEDEATAATDAGPAEATAADADETDEPASPPGKEAATSDLRRSAIPVWRGRFVIRGIRSSLRA